MRSILCLMLVACGGGSGSELGAERTTISIRIVNLFSAGQGAPGPAVDVYRAQSPFIGNKREAAPVVRALAYGTASAWFHQRQNADQLRFYDTGTLMGGAFAGFAQDTMSFRDGDQVTIFINGDKSGAGTGPFIPAWETRFENNPTDTPVADPARALLYIDDAWRSPYNAQDPGLYLGSGTMCLASTTSAGTPNLIVSGEKTYAFAAGSFSVAMFLNPPSGLPDCTGAPAFGPITVSSAAAGSRTWLMPYGTSWTDKRLLTLSFGP